MSKLVEFDLGVSGLSYVAATCRAGHTLSRLLPDLIRLENGSATTFLPANVSLSRLPCFESGRLTKADATTEHVVSMFQTFLTTNARRHVILDDAMSRKGDRILSRAAAALFFHDSDVYQYFMTGETDSGRIRTALTDVAANSHFVALMVSDWDRILSPGQDVPLNYLTEMAIRTDQIVVGAYDGEGFIVWTNDSTPGR